MRRIEAGNFIGAARLLHETNPLAEVCGHVCGPRPPCEAVCNRLNFAANPVRVADLQAWVCREAGAAGWPAAGHRAPIWPVAGTGPASWPVGTRKPAALRAASVGVTALRAASAGATAGGGTPPGAASVSATAVPSAALPETSAAEPAIQASARDTAPSMPAPTPSEKSDPSERSDLSDWSEQSTPAPESLSAAPHSDAPQPTALDTSPSPSERSDLSLRSAPTPQARSAHPILPALAPFPEIAVVGAGPAGLSCAYYLARAGCRVTLLERSLEPGGALLAYPAGSPALEAARRDIAGILAQQIEFVANFSLGGERALDGEAMATGATVAELAQDYDAVYLATGAGSREIFRGLELEPLGGDVWRVCGAGADTVFAGGDLLRGPCTVAQAVADGIRAARAMLG